jgi:hypothetical protein
MKPTVEACQARDPVVDVRDFEDRLTAYMAIDPQCKGVRFVRRYTGFPSGTNDSAFDVMQRGRYWMLDLNYTPGAKKQQWELDRLKPSTHAKGEGDPKEIARNVCTIATSRGAKLD